jgi:hypothetical protein
MSAAVRPYVTAGVALVGASVISVSPIAPSQLDIRVANPAVSLAAASWANAPVNIVNAFLSAPQAEVDGINRLAAAMEWSGSWWVYTPENVLGWDPPNFEMTKGLVDTLLPFPTLSTPFGTHLNWWLAANLPMHEGCSGLPPCTDPIGMLSSMFTVPPWAFYTGDGYTFPTIFNPISVHEGEVGQELGETGQEVDWSGQTVKLDPNEGWNALMTYLQSDPTEVTYPTAQEAFNAFTRLGTALWNSQSYIWNPDYSISAYVWRPFAPFLCPNCNPEDPFLPPEPSQTVTPQPQQTLTLAVSGPSATPGNEVEPPSAQQKNGLAVGDFANTPDSAADALTTVPNKMAPEAAKSGSGTATEATEPPSNAPSAPILDLTKDGNKVEPVPVGPKHRAPGGGLSGALTSVQDTINSTISKITGGLNSGGTTSDTTTSSEASTGNTGG